MMVAQTRLEGEEEGRSGQTQDILKAEPMGFTEGLEAACEEKRGVEDGSCKVFGLTSGRTELLSTEIRGTGKEQI